MSQLVLPFLADEDLTAESFLVTSTTESAWLWLRQWPENDARKKNPITLLLGPRMGGKTHLLKLWALRHNASDWSLLDHNDHDTTERCFVCDGIHVNVAVAIARINRAMADNARLLIALPNKPDPRKTGLPDLTSRLRRAYAITIGEPDDDLMNGLLLKLFTDRQMMASSSTIAYLVKRLPRSHLAVHRAVEQLDKASLAQGRRVTIPLVKQQIDERLI